MSREERLTADAPSGDFAGASESPRDPAAASLLAAWDAQQEAFIAEREGRFRAMLDVVELACGPAPRVLDIACGPGSLSARVLERLPGARVVGLDVDPLLLDLARRALLPRHGERLTLLDADLDGDAWPAQARAALGDEPADAIVSTTALHWLMPDGLVRVYAQAAELLAPGGVLVNGDHLRFDGRSPALRRIASAHDGMTQRSAHAAGAPTWEAWWGQARSAPDAEALAAERDRRFAGRRRLPPRRPRPGRLQRGRDGLAAVRRLRGRGGAVSGAAGAGDRPARAGRPGVPEAGA